MSAGAGDTVRFAGSSEEGSVGQIKSLDILPTDFLRTTRAPVNARHQDGIFRERFRGG